MGDAMSMDIGGAYRLGVALYPTDNRHGDEQFFDNEDLFQPPALLNLYTPFGTTQDGMFSGYPGYVSPWWPSNCGLMIGDLGLDVSMLQQVPQWSTPGITLTGCNGRLGFVGYTRDAYGSPLAGCTVRCFRTSTNELQSVVTSDANGFYMATTPYNDAHYLVIHDSTGASGGASVSTAVPA